MLTPEQLRDIVGNVTCSLFPTWGIVLNFDNPDMPYLQVEDADGCCTFTGEKLSWRGRKWLLDFTMTETQIVNTCFKAYETAIEHEFRELFRYRGQPVYNPHRDINALCGLKRLDKDYGLNGASKQ